MALCGSMGGIGARTYWPRAWLIVIAVATLAALLLLASAWLQQRLDAQITAINTFQLDRTLLGHLMMHEGNHSVPVAFRDDPSDWVLLPEGLEQLRQIPGVASVAGFERRGLDLEVGPPAARRRITVAVVAVPKGFFLDAGIGGIEAEKIVSAGQALMPQALLARERLVALDQPQFILKVSSGDPPPGTLGFVATVPRNEVVETKLAVLPLRLPEGMARFEKVIFISVDHPVRIGGPMRLPDRSLWIRLQPNADIATTTKAIRAYLVDAPRVFKNAHIEIENLGDMMAGQVGVKELKRMQLQMLAGALAALLSVVAALVFVRWGRLLQELALRQALGQGRLTAVLKSSRQSLAQILGGATAGLLLAAVLAKLLWQTSFAGLMLQLLAMALITLLATALLPVSAWWASRRMPLQVLNIGGR